MDFIIDAITKWIKDFLIEAITGNLSNMFGDVNTKVATIAGEVGKTPEQWNSGVFSMIHSLSESVIVPIAGLVIAAVLSYELIHMIIDKNNMHDFDTFIFFKWIIKAGIATYGVYLCLRSYRGDLCFRKCHCRNSWRHYLYADASQGAESWEHTPEWCGDWPD